MKKVLALILALVMVFALAACGSSNNDKDPSTTPDSGSNSAAQPGNDATVLDNTSSGKLAGGLTTNDDHGITAEGHSTGLSITVAQMTDISATAPFAQGGGRNDVRYLIYDTLAIMKVPGGSVDEMDWIMAKNIEKIDDDTYDIEIYDYIHDYAGNAITADDVVWSYNKLVEVGTSGKFSSHLGSIEKLDDYKVRLVIKNNALGMAQYMLQYCPVVSQASYESQTDGELSQSPIGTGMYKITEYVAGGYVTLSRVEDYWQTDSSLWSYGYAGQMDTIKFIIMTEASQRAIGLENKSVDIVPYVSREDIGNFMNDDGTAKEGYNVLKVLNSTTNAMFFNCSEESVCSDINLRMAISCAIDRIGVMDGTYGKGGYLLSNEYATASISDYDPKWDEEGYYPYDLSAAKQYLDASGLSDVKLRIMCISNADYKTMAELIQAYLSAIGITVEINAYDNALYEEYKKDPTKWDLLISTGGSSDYCLDSLNLCLPCTNTSTGTNSFMIADYEAEELLNKAGSLTEHSQENVEALHVYLKEHCYFVPFGTYYKYSAAQDNLLVWALHPWNYLILSGCIYE